MKLQKIIIVVIVAVIVVGGFFWLNGYIYNEKQSTDVESYTETSVTDLEGIFPEVLGNYSIDKPIERGELKCSNEDSYIPVEFCSEELKVEYTNRENSNVFAVWIYVISTGYNDFRQVQEAWSDLNFPEPLNINGYKVSRSTVNSIYWFPENSSIMITISESDKEFIIDDKYAYRNPGKIDLDNPIIDYLVEKLPPEEF